MSRRSWKGLTRGYLKNMKNVTGFKLSKVLFLALHWKGKMFMCCLGGLECVSKGRNNDQEAEWARPTACPGISTGHATPHTQLPPLLQCPGKSALPSGREGTEYRISAQEKERFFISPKHDFCNLPSRYYGYHMTSELVSTETAIVGADKPQICPGAFINNKKRWPSFKNTPTRGRLFFPHYFFLCAHEHSNWGHGTGSAMENG